ncbi:DUF6455 family protein [Sedimentitalea sp. JM2-8]|uniref:DUF6455 family protein n=1 Tax=Sedimentitalea xiamensis TaxID=3050037 RepID=A0ABT7FBU5_9RHOB|nr:DUF6455 family protein [Sedimentitalea xiamensis]MDK3072314.1 DUF6455 family protein [Sedimentitalea xiamensis]
MDGSQTHLEGIDRHFWLTRSVARVMGISLSRAMREGRLNPAEYCEMVARCRSGNCHEACQQWLARHVGPAETAPSGCLHRDWLDRLRKA